MSPSFRGLNGRPRGLRLAKTVLASIPEGSVHQPVVDVDALGGYAQCLEGFALGGSNGTLDLPVALVDKVLTRCPSKIG